jgi:hypothetical protein
MANNDLIETRLVDIEKLDGSDWEIQTGINRIGISYRSRHHDSPLIFSDEQGIRQSWKFRNEAIITFRGSILIHNPSTRTG